MINNGSLEKKIALALLLGLTCVSQNAYAEEESGQNSTEPKYTLEAITVEAARPDWESNLSPGTVTVIRPSDYKGEQKTLPELLKQVPGVHVREVNGKGQYTTVSVRGSTSSQVGVFVDGILFNLGGDAAADISTIPVQNVERIEVYRGYIPARFGGTFMGGVINVVTKRPTKSNVQASIGQSSFGGYKGSLQLDSPLGSGSLMVGVNREQSEGDFKYKNNSYDVDKTYKWYMDNNKSYADMSLNSYNNAFSGLKQYGFQDSNGNAFAAVSVADAESLIAANQDVYNTALAAAKADFEKNFIDNFWWGDEYAEYYSYPGIAPDQLLSTLRDTSASSQEKIYQSLVVDYTFNKNNIGTMPVWRDENDKLYVPKTVDEYIKIANKTFGIQAKTIQDVIAYYNGVPSCNIEEYFKRFANSQALDNLNGAAAAAQEAEKYKKQGEEIKDNDRWRKSNDYKNTDAILKWQDQHWLAKATWKEIDRHMPFPYNSNWSNSESIDAWYAYNDPYDFYYHRRQKLTDKTLLLGRRDTTGNLEWGWSLNYLDQNKKYWVDNWQEKMKNPDYTNTHNSTPLSWWSDYSSERWGGKLDGTYKAGERHLIEFLVDASRQTMQPTGYLMDSRNAHLMGWKTNSYRDYYKQDILNLQVQDTITLNDAGNLWMTPSIRYNSSLIYGRSSQKNENDGGVAAIVNKEDEQRDTKTTWQLALKKEVTSHLTLQATGGTYYRLLNMYEIAGDGAGILPMPLGDGTNHVLYPHPEEGSQWDLSAIWDGQIFGADTAKIQLTYFGRKSDDMLQLFSRHFFFFYNNAAHAKVNGLEMQADMSWKKWDANLQATYTKATDVKYDYDKLLNMEYDHQVGVLAYQPDWEGSIRFTYRPDNKYELFTQWRYVGEMYLSPVGDSTGYIDKQSSLTSCDLGIKYKPNKKAQITLGVNDVFNKAVDMYGNRFGGMQGGNIEYPIQGRTYYATMQYNF